MIDSWIKRPRGDIFRTNTLEYLSGPVPRDDPRFERGSFLVSMRNLDAIAVVDPATRKVVWSTRGAFGHQHDPKILPNGNLLLFDNDGSGQRSTVMEFDLLPPALRWQYRGDRDHPFYTHGLGTAQRLANGNTLITESDNGRAFEVTPAHEIVWEFRSPHRAGPRSEFVATLTEVLRLPQAFRPTWTQGQR